MNESLTQEDLAYMRETQAAHRPTEAVWTARRGARTATGGSGYTWGPGEPVAVRLDAARDDVPEDLANRYGVTSLTKITADQALDYRAGDRFTVSPTEVYELVTDGDPDRWATAQELWAVRQTFPART